jgi:nicotinamidase-related amidase/alkylated DNA repair dioxygenase AlkB
MNVIKNNAKKSALLVIDMQNDFLQPSGCMGDYFVKSEHIMKNLTHIVKHCRLNNIPIIWVRGAYPELEKEQIEEIKREPFHLQTHVDNDNHCCRMGTDGYEFYGPVKSLILDITNTNNDHFIVKEWYSCFKNTDLKQKLDSMGITNIIVTGVATNVCVFSTTKHADELGYSSCVISDCVGAKQNKQKLGFKKIRQIRSARLMTTIELLNTDLCNLPTLELSGFGPDSFVHFNLGLPNDAFRQVLNEVDWHTIAVKGGKLSRKISIQGTFVSNEFSTTYPIYRHPAENQPNTIPWTPIVSVLKNICSEYLGIDFNHALVQLYQGGKSWISEHSDKTLDIEKGSDIVSLSLGATRTMILISKNGKKERFRIALPNNSLFVLGPKSNRNYWHTIKQDKRMEQSKTQDERDFDGIRISLTFRRIATFKKIFKSDGKDDRGDDDDESILLGQGAPPKEIQQMKMTKEEYELQKEKLYHAFGNENRQSDQFSWDDNYAGGSIIEY